MATEPSPGVVIGGRYRLDALLGEGGMGTVWAATHLVTRQRVALKMLKGRFSERPDHRRRFWREARAASTVQHPNVVRIHDLFELEDHALVMVMDLLSGRTFAEVLRAKGPLALEEAASYLVPAVSAVGAAHACGIVHRDLKPENIFLVDSGERPEVRVLDFGIAKLASTEDAAAVAGSITDTGAMLGTPYYMSPEQGLGERDVDHRTDVWAFGVILFEALAGARPVEGENLGQVIKRLMSDAILPLDAVVPDLPGEVTALVKRMLSRDRSRRPEDLREVLAVLEHYTSVRAPAFGPAYSEAEERRDSAEPSAPLAVRVEAMASTERAISSDADTANPTAAPIPQKRRPARVALLGAGVMTAIFLLAAWWRIRTPSSVSDPQPSVGAAALPGATAVGTAAIAEQSPHERAAAASTGVASPISAAASPASSVLARVEQSPVAPARSRRPLHHEGEPVATGESATPAPSSNAPVAPPKPGLVKRPPAPANDGLVDDPPF